MVIDHEKLVYSSRRFRPLLVHSSCRYTSYERQSLITTSNLLFSHWEHIFTNPMAAAAAIDWVVHDSVITEFDVPSYRSGVNHQNGQE